VLLFGTQAVSLIFANSVAANQTPLSLVDLIVQEVPFLILAAAGVGIFMRRNARDTAARLGLVVPAWWQLVLALAAAGVFFAFGQSMDALSHAWTPGLAHQVDTTTQRLFGDLGGPVGIAALALAPGICEEILFRGALQPRLGIIATALLFASIHAQYGVSLDALSVFVIALGLGLIRKYTNTTTSMACHIAYNLVVGIGITGARLDVAIAAEALLIAATGYAIWSRRRRSIEMPANP
jgi:membrane protease YdiL (CAAX protease family)